MTRDGRQRRFFSRSENQASFNHMRAYTEQLKIQSQPNGNINESDMEMHR